MGGGLLPGGGGTERLPRLIGRDRALEAILGGDDYGADLAERYGWVTRTMPDAELDDSVDALAARLASFDKTALAAAKTQINRATLPPDADLETAYGEFLTSLTWPGFQARVPGFGKLAADYGHENVPWALTAITTQSTSAASQWPGRSGVRHSRISNPWAKIPKPRT